MTLKIKKANLYYYALFLYLLNYFIHHSTIGVGFATYTIIRGITILLLMVHFARNIKRIRGITGLIALFILVCSLASLYYSQRDDLFMIGVFVVASVNTDFKESVKYFLWANILTVFLITVLSLGGIIQNIQLDIVRSGKMISRYAMGFAHPNIFSTLVMQLIILITYVYNEKMKLLNYVLLLMMGFVTYGITYSRTSLNLLILFFLMIWISRRLSKTGLSNLWNFISKNAIRFFLVAGLILSFFIAKNFRNLSGWLFKFVNIDTLNSRFKLLEVAIKTFPITFLGQRIEIVSSMSFFSMFAGQTAVLDNGFVYLVLVYGILNAIWFLCGYLGTIRSASRAKDRIYIICVILYVVFSFFEKYFVSLPYNFTTLMIGQYLYNRVR